MAVNWNYFNKKEFEELNDKYLPQQGEGSTKATQIVTALNKLIYKYYNDGDVFDNTHHLEGWVNDLSDYANWLYYYTTTEIKLILEEIENCHNDSEYEDLLKELADNLFNKEYLAEQNKLEKVFTIYDCVGKFKFEELDEDEEYYY